MPQALALLEHHDAVLLDVFEDGAVLERLALDILVAVHVDHSLPGLGRPTSQSIFNCSSTSKTSRLPPAVTIRWRTYAHVSFSVKGRADSRSTAPAGGEPRESGAR